VSTARVFLLIPPHVFISIFLFDRLVGGGFLILRGWCAVGLIPKRLGLMAFSLAPGWIKVGDGVFSLPQLALHVVFLPSS